MILTACHSGKGKIIDPVKRSVIARALEEGERRGEQKGAAWVIFRAETILYDTVW